MNLNSLLALTEHNNEPYLSFDLQKLQTYSPPDQFVAGLRHFCLLCCILGYGKPLNNSGGNSNIRGISLNTIAQYMLYLPLGVMYPKVSDTALKKFINKPMLYYLQNFTPQQNGGNVQKPIHELYERCLTSLNGQDPWERVFELKHQVRNDRTSETAIEPLIPSSRNTNNTSYNLMPSIPMVSVQAGGGQQKARYIRLNDKSRQSKVYYDAAKKPYIRLNNKNVFLSDIRGRYKNVM